MDGERMGPWDEEAFKEHVNDYLTGCLARGFDPSSETVGEIASGYIKGIEKRHERLLVSLLSIGDWKDLTDCYTPGEMQEIAQKAIEEDDHENRSFKH